MTAVTELPPPAGLLSGIERVPGMRGTAAAGIPLFAAVGGIPRGEVVLLGRPFRADTSTTADNDPGVGRVRWNAPQGSATVLYLDNADSNNVNVSYIVADLLAGGYVWMQASGKTRAAVFQKWKVTSVVLAGGYFRLGVALEASNGSFMNDELLHLSLQQPEPEIEAPEPIPSRNVVTEVAPVSNVLTLDASLGDYFKATLTANCTLSVINALQACTLSLDLTQGSPARTLLWPAGFKWQGGITKAISTATGAVDKLVISTTDSGATWLADLGKGYA